MIATSTARNDEDVMTRPTISARAIAVAHTAVAATRSARPTNRREASRTTTNLQVYGNRNQRAVDACGCYLLLAANVSVDVPGGIGERNGLVHN